MMLRFIAALGTAAILTGAAGSSVAFAQPVTPVPAPPQTMVPRPLPQTAAPAPIPPHTMVPMPVGTLALDARLLRAKPSASGYTLTGQALVSDPCHAARFDPVVGNIVPPLFKLTQYRKPGTMGQLCIQKLTWVTVQPRAVISPALPRSVSVLTQKGSVHVPIM